MSSNANATPQAPQAPGYYYVPGQDKVFKPKAITPTVQQFITDTGAVPATPEQAQRYEQALKFDDTLAGVAGSTAYGAAKGLTFGLAKDILTGTGLAKEETLNALERANPTAFMAGDIGASAASLAASLVTGGATTAAGAAAAKLGATKAGQKVLATALGAKTAKGAKAVGTALAKADPGFAVRAVDTVAQRAGEKIAKALVTKGAIKAGGIAQSAIKTGVQFGLEGAAYEAGQIAHEMDIGDPELTAQYVMSRLGATGLISSIVGAGGAAAAGGARKAFNAMGNSVQKVVSGVAKETGADVVPDALLSRRDSAIARALDLKIPQLDMFKAPTRAQNAKRVKEAFDELQKMKHPIDGKPIVLPFRDHSTNQERFIQAFESNADYLNSAYDEVSNVSRAAYAGLDLKKKAREALQKEFAGDARAEYYLEKGAKALDQLFSRAPANDMAQEIADYADNAASMINNALREELKKPTPNSITVQALERVAEQFDAKKSYIQELGKNLKSEIYSEIRPGVDRTTASAVKAVLREVVPTPPKRIYKTVPSLGFPQVRDMRKTVRTMMDEARGLNPKTSSDPIYYAIERVLNDTLQDEMKAKLGSQYARTFVPAQKTYAKMQPLYAGVGRRRNMVQMYARVGLLDQVGAGGAVPSAMVGAALGGGPGALLGAAARQASAEGMSQIRKRAASVELWQIERAAKLAAIKQAAMNGQAQAEKSASAIARAIFGQEAKVGAKRGLYMGAGVAAKNYADALNSANETETRQKIKAAVMNDFGVGMPPEDMQINGPDDTRPAPEIERAAEQTANAIYNELQKNLPARPQGQIMGKPLAAKNTQISSADEMRFARVAQALNDPQGELERVAAGDYSVAAYKAITAAYPALVADVAYAVAEQVLAHDGPITPKGRALLGLIAPDYDASLNPQYMQALQRAAQATPQEPNPQPQQGPTGMRVTGLQSVGKVATEMATGVDSLSGSEAFTGPV